MSAINSVEKQKLTLNGKYKEFLASGAKPKNNFSNVFNLFDDSNLIDKILLRETRTYLNSHK